MLKKIASWNKYKDVEGLISGKLWPLAHADWFFAQWAHLSFLIRPKLRSPKPCPIFGPIHGL